MCEMKCPICGTPLEYDIGYDGDYFCAKCGKAKMFGSEELWQALTDSIKEHDLCHDALVERTKELDCTRKALDVAVDALKTIKYSKKSDAINLRHKANKALIEIYKIKDQTALEQKE